MGAHDRNRIRSLFEETMDRPTKERPAFLDAACDDTAIREQVEALLVAFARADESRFLEDPTNEVFDPADPRAAPEFPSNGSLTGTTIGRYELLDVLGEGGFGTVYRARQTAPVERTVALKLIKRGMDTDRVVARFEAERQALAIMDHPGIAHVYDGGATDSGRPYFVMELVEGTPITEHCERHALDTRARLELFMGVCDAIQHAHQKGIIHRDLKPSNVLVTMPGDRPMPKVIDFGIAKALDRKLTAKTLHTEQRHLVGTPQYMSPEQVEMSPDIDTRSDVYALGVLLYELLTGLTPFDGERLSDAGFDDVRRIIREEEPPKPSTRWCNHRKTPARADRPRRDDSRSLTRELRGDLDWITMRALEKDRRRRYGSPGELAADIRRHLDHAPVTAGPPSATYRLGKFVRRHPGKVLAALVALPVLAAIVASTGIALREARQHRTAALQLEIDRERNNLTDGVFQAVALHGEPGRDQLLGVLRDEARGLDEASEPDGRLADKPLVVAALQSWLGTSYGLLGDYAGAKRHLPRALAVHRRKLGDVHPKTLNDMTHLALAHRRLGELDEAETYYVEALQVGTALLGEGHLDTARTKTRLADVYTEQGRLKEAAALLREAHGTQQQVLGADDPDTLLGQHTLAALLWRQGALEEAEVQFLDVLRRRRRVHGREHSETLRSESGLGRVYASQGRYEDAIATLASTLSGQRIVLGTVDPETVATAEHLAAALSAVGAYAAAEPVLVEARNLRLRAWGDEDPATLRTEAHLANVYAALGRHTDAQTLLVEIGEARRRSFGPRDPETMAAAHDLAVACGRAGRLVEAEALLDEVLEAMRSELGDTHPRTLLAMSGRLKLLMCRGDDANAETLADELLDATRTTDDDHPCTASVLRTVAGVYRLTGRTDEALPLLVRAVEMSRRTRGDEHTLTLETMTDLALLLGDVGHHDDAAEVLGEVLAVRRRVTGATERSTLRVMTHLASAELARGRPLEAEPLLSEALDTWESMHGPEHPETLRTLHDLAEVYVHAGRPEEAELAFLRLDERRRIVLQTVGQRRYHLGDRHMGTRQAQSQVARLLLTWPVASERDPQRALALIQKACNGVARPPAAWLDTLALAEFRTGNGTGELPARDWTHDLDTDDADLYLATTGAIAALHGRDAP